MLPKTEVALKVPFDHCSVEVVDHGARHGVRVHYMNHLTGEGTNGSLDYEEARARAILASIEKWRRLEAKRLEREALETLKEKRKK